MGAILSGNGIPRKYIVTYKHVGYMGGRPQNGVLGIC